MFYNLKVCMHEKEYLRLKEGFEKTTCRSLSEYIRKLIFGKKVSVYYRNQTFDEFTEESIQLKKALIILCEQGDTKALETDWLKQKVQEMQVILNKIADACSQK